MEYNLPAYLRKRMQSFLVESIANDFMNFQKVRQIIVNGHEGLDGMDDTRFMEVYHARYQGMIDDCTVTTDVKNMYLEAQACTAIEEMISGEETENVPR